MKNILFICLLALAASVRAQPWHTEVLWQREGERDSSNYGHSIAALGDQNHDGYNDWAVFASAGTYCPWAYVELFHGGNPPSQEPYHVFRRDSIINCLRDIQVAGDLNGDGYLDYWLYVDYVNDPGAHYLIFFGGPEDDFRPDSVLVMTEYGLYVPIGDHNGDGHSDLARRTLRNTDLFWGGQSDTIPDWSVNVSLGYLSFGNLNGDQSDDFSGSRSTSGPDIYLGASNPDTFPAFQSGSEPILPWFVGNIIGSTYQDLGQGGINQAHIQAGSPNFDLNIDLTLNFLCDGGGPSVYPLSDVNADGYDDLGLMGWCGGGHGIFRLYLGGSSPSANSVLTLSAGGPILGDMRIQSVCGVGDIDGDGVGDFAIAGHTDLEYDGFRGRAVIISGDSSYHVDAVEPSAPGPSSFHLAVFPNPFNNRTTVTLDLPPGVGKMTLSIYNLLGQQVRTIEKANASGMVRFSLEAQSEESAPLTSGVYILRAKWRGYQQSQKIIVLK